MIEISVESRTQRLQFLSISSDTTGVLNQLRPLLEGEYDYILDEFYTHLGKYPQLSSMVVGKTDRLKAGQKRHWKQLFEGTFDEQYFTSAAMVGKIHERTGLEPQFYIGGYYLVVSHLIRIATQQFGDQPDVLRVVLQEALKPVFLDLDLGISMYNAFGAAAREKAKAVLMDSVDTINLNIQTVGSSTEELTATLNELAANATREASLSGQIKTVAETTEQEINTLVASAKGITKVVEVINSIASQTNLLALNATIQAASAGEAGKGFAVVANEVKELARSSANATQQIREQVNQMMHQLNFCLDKVQSLAALVPELSQMSQMLASSVEEQSAVAREISTSLQNVLHASQKLCDDF